MMAFSAAAGGAEAPAGIQYKYDPVPRAADDITATASREKREEGGTSSRFPLVLIGAILLIVLLFGVKNYADRRRRKVGGGPIPMPTVPLALMAATVIGALAFGAGGTVAASSPKAPRNFLGMAPQEGFTTVDTQRMSLGGVQAIRLPVSWPIVEPEGSGEYDWGLYEEGFRAAASVGIPILPVLYGTPAWMARKTTTLPTSSSQLKSWKRFVAAAVKRFGTGGTFWDEPEQVGIEPTPPKDWQLWNEVNFKYFANPVSAKNYGRMVNAAAPVIRANDPRADVMLSGLFGRPKGPPSKAVDAPKFLKQLSRYVKAGTFDSIALHPYSPNTKALKKLIAEFRFAANKSGYKRKPINITEIGWGSGPAKNAFLKGSEAKQASLLSSALGFLIKSRKRYNTESAYWYSWKDTDPKGVNCNFCYSVGLFKYVKPAPGETTSSALEPKKAWRAYVKLSGGRFGGSGS